MPETTPLRRNGGAPGVVCVLSQPGIHYADRSEDRVLEIVRSTTQLESLSDDLEDQAETWAEFYHLAKGRAAVLRALDLDPGDRVLEVGAGCGAVTRFLGESVRVVDAIEPMRARADVAASRTRDLSSVRVFVGTVDDIPPTPAYDLIVVIGVLEYVAAGASDDRNYVTFLQKLARMLNPGGIIVCAIENRMGVKYLCGAPEDHSGRLFHGVEGYPEPGPARTFSRTELASLFSSAGLTPRFLHVFPDYKLARVVFSEDLLASPMPERSLAWRIPRFPSPDWETPRPRLAAEELLWKSIIDDGVASSFSNSFVVLAGEVDPSGRWPSQRLATYFTNERRATFNTQTTVQRDGGRIHFDRRRLSSTDRTARVGDLEIRAQDATFMPGEDLSDLVSRSGGDVPKHYLRSWAQLVESSGCRPVELDLIPENVVVSASGDLNVVDREWFHYQMSTSDVVQRGIYRLGCHLAHRTPPTRWLGSTVADVVLQLGHVVGLRDDRWLLETVSREASIQRAVYGEANWWTTRGASDIQQTMRSELASPLEELQLGLREPERRMREAETLRPVVERVEAGFWSTLRMALGRTTIRKWVTRRERW